MNTTLLNSKTKEINNRYNNDGLLKRNFIKDMSIVNISRLTSIADLGNNIKFNKESIKYLPDNHKSSLQNTFLISNLLVRESLNKINNYKVCIPSTSNLTKNTEYIPSN